MGLIGDLVFGTVELAGALAVGTVKVAGKVAVAGAKALVETAVQAQGVRNSSGGMSNAELANGFLDKNNSMAERIGYGAALQDRYRK